MPFMNLGEYYLNYLVSYRVSRDCALNIFFCRNINFIQQTSGASPKFVFVFVSSFAGSLDIYGYSVCWSITSTFRPGEVTKNFRTIRQSKKGIVICVCKYLLFSIWSTISDRVCVMWIIKSCVPCRLLDIFRTSPYEWDNPHPCNPNPEELHNTFTLFNSMWFAMGSFLQQGCDFLPK